ncbi:dTMP kinase [Granulosicoccus antarcticus]|uniref:Thymidylate kinase n=1 Tax=Granulosicoccus antarcticus IMCC3135 TaxID=1192854 RepID=A0A2Z2P2S0_9GAMM|nr:dTMP kinase [Granulosicoccus antarcticus]ASJ74867.1 Thymidylate kinase [Granulosicoccus antarcticus IMCC3135]
MSMRGKFITLEGLEGVGKTTNRQFVEALLDDANIAFVGTREPGGTPLGESLRELVLAADGQVDDVTELLLMTASRVEHIARVIEPALTAGKWVLCDRFLDASIAYQGAGRQLGVERVAELHALMGVTLEPDLTILLDMPVQEGLERMAARSEPDRIEREAHAFFERARAAYLQRASDAPERVVVIDAGRSLELVQESVRQALQPILSEG